MKSSARMLLSCGRPAARRSFGLLARPKRPLLATITRSVTSRRTGLAGERKEPQAQEPLAPSPFCHMISPSGQEAQVVLQDGHDVGRQASIRLATQVGHVDGDPAAGLEHPLALGEHLSQELQVLEIRAGHTLAVQLLLVLLAGEIGRRGHHESDRVVGQLGHLPGIAAQACFRQRGVGVHVLVGADLWCLEASVEGVGHVGFPAPDTEAGGRRATSSGHDESPTLPGPGPWPRD